MATAEIDLKFSERDNKNTQQAKFRSSLPLKRDSNVINSLNIVLIRIWSMKFDERHDNKKYKKGNITGA